MVLTHAEAYPRPEARLQNSVMSLSTASIGYTCGMTDERIEPTPAHDEDLHGIRADHDHGRYDEGEAVLPADPEKAREGRFDDGEALFPADPEKSREGRFDDGVADDPADPEKSREGSFDDGYPAT